MADLQIGDIAPDFTLPTDGNEEITLSSLQGQKVVLYFYPKDNTPGCTAQACDLRDNYKALLNAGYVVLGVSPDHAKSHKKFIEKLKILISSTPADKIKFFHFNDYS